MLLRSNAQNRSNPATLATPIFYETGPKKKNIKRDDFEKAMLDSGMDEKANSNVFTKFSKALPKWTQVINESFLPIEKREGFQALISRMATRIRLIDMDPKILTSSS